MKKGLILLNNKVEDVEALATKALLERAGFKMTSFTLESKKEINTAYNQTIIVNYVIEEITEKDYDFLVLPGGPHVFKNLEDKRLDSLILAFNKSNKLIAAICAAPLFLNKLNLLENKTFTAYPEVVSQMSGKHLKDLKAAVSGNIITARSAGVVYDFVFEIIKYLEDSKMVENLKKSIVF